MSSIKELFAAVLDEIIPTANDLALINEIIEMLKSLLDKRAKELNITYIEMEAQGSTGIKQTQVRNDFDIDFFIGLDYNLYKPKYQGLSKNKLKKEFKKDFLELCNNWILKAISVKEFQNAGLLYAEHPYVTVEYIDPSRNIELKMDIVLYFELPLEFIKNNGPITAVDRSPWHGRFVRDNLTIEQKNEVRLLKQFFKACHAYGDKSAVGMAGFIGYSAELLIYHFGTIQKVFENFNKLPENPMDYFKRDIKELQKIVHFQKDFLILTDPIDSNRNVASAISEKAYHYVNKKVQEFLDNPNKELFEIKPVPESDLSNVDNFYIIELKNTDYDVHYTISRDKLYSLGDSIKSNGEREFSHAKRFGKIVFEVYFEDKINEYNLALYCETQNISPTYTRRGPPINEKQHLEKFKEKNPNFFEKDGFLWTEAQREYTEFIEFLKNFIKNKIPENLAVVNLSKAHATKSISGKRAIYVLKNMVLPFIK